MCYLFITNGDCAAYRCASYSPANFCASSVLQETIYIILIYAAPLSYVMSNTYVIHTCVIQEGFELRTSVDTSFARITNLFITIFITAVYHLPSHTMKKIQVPALRS